VRKFRPHAKPSPQARVRDGERTPSKVALYATCYINFNGSGVGHDLLAVLLLNDIPYVLVEKEACCGMPLLEQGNLDETAAKKEKNIPVLTRYAREGYALIAAIPRCVLMYLGGKTYDTLSLIPGAQVKVVERCSGHAGTSV
jgi:Fe-S oxidoreductase